MFRTRMASFLTVLVLSGLLTACGGGGGSAGGTSVPSVSHYQITGNVTGLSGGASLGLQVNGQSPLTVTAGGGFQFPGSFATGTAYQVSMSAQPAGETCSITNGSGTVGTANVTDIQVACTTNPAQTYTIGGTVTGLTSGTLVLQDNNGNNLSITSGGAFTFSTALYDQAAYDVTVLSQPSGQTCTIGNGSGTVPGSNVTGVTVGCTANSSQTYTIGGSISGLSGSVSLQESAGGSIQTFTANGTFVFSTKLSGSAPYYVTVATQPAGQTCVVHSGTGTAGTSNVASVTVSCSTNPTYSISGAVSGLNSGASVTMLNNGTDPLTVSTNGSFTFPAQLPSGATYGVTVSTEPLHEVCTVTNDAGTVGSSNVTNIAVSCATGPQFAYVANKGDNTISAYSIDTSTGALTQIMGSPFVAGSGPSSVTVSPNGAFAYVTNSNSNNISAYSITPSTGALVPVTGSPFAAGSGPSSVTVSPNGAFAYVTNFYSNNASSYSINQSTGELTPITGSPFAAGPNPISMAMSPNGAFAYVANESSTSVSVYSIDPSTGTITPLTGSPYPAGVRPYSVAIDQTQLYGLVFVANLYGGNVSVYRFDSTTGMLSSFGTLTAGLNPASVTVSPNGAFVYVANSGSNSVSAYSAAGGAAGTFGTGNVPMSIAIAWP